MIYGCLHVSADSSNVISEVLLKNISDLRIKDEFHCTFMYSRNSFLKNDMPFGAFAIDRQEFQFDDFNLLSPNVFVMLINAPVSRLLFDFTKLLGSSFYYDQYHPHISVETNSTRLPENISSATKIDIANELDSYQLYFDRITIQPLTII